MKRLPSTSTPLSSRPALIALAGLVLIGACLIARAQPAPATPTAEADAPFDQPAVQVGSATQRLLALQASGQAASPTPRPIPGDVAGRSYDRYLKSFEFPIPERFGTTVKPTGSGTTSPSM